MRIFDRIRERRVRRAKRILFILTGRERKAPKNEPKPLPSPVLNYAKSMAKLHNKPVSEIMDSKPVRHYKEKYT